MCSNAVAIDNQYLLTVDRNLCSDQCPCPAGELTDAVYGNQYQTMWEGYKRAENEDD